MAACFFAFKSLENAESLEGVRSWLSQRSVTATLAIIYLDVTSVDKFFKTQLLRDDVTNTPRSYFQKFKRPKMPLPVYLIALCYLKNTSKQTNKKTNKQTKQVTVGLKN